MVGAALFCSCANVGAVEIKGTVRSATAENASIATEGEFLPSVGDPVEVYFKLPGADTEISVGSGKVTAVRGDSIEAKIDKATGTVSKNQLARITSEKPQKRSAITAATASPIPIPASSTAASNSSSASEAASSDTASRKFFEEGLARQNQHDYDGAIAAYNKATQSNTSDPLIYANRALCYAQKSDWEMSMDDFGRAISINPNIAKAYSERAAVRIYREDYGPGLLEDCNKAIALDANYAPVYVRRGVYYAHEGNMKFAEADWKKAIALDPATENSVKEDRAFFRTSRKESRHRKR